MVRLLQHLEATVHGDAVTQPVCARCDRTGLRLTRNTPEGRCSGRSSSTPTTGSPATSCRPTHRTSTPSRASGPC
ncbi:hypothetical protein STRMOE7_03860 [Streptomyces sp. MOE7]|nr:hypothetical protein STRMOE7_03860 [Streptomyces sp. MOE7]